MADVTYRFAGIPHGVVASVEDVTDPGVEVTTVTGTQGGYGDADLPVGDYIATFQGRAGQQQVSGDLASPTDVDYARSQTGSSIAGEVTYDNTTSELTAEDVQAALDEIVGRIVALETP